MRLCICIRDRVRPSVRPCYFRTTKNVISHAPMTTKFDMDQETGQFMNDIKMSVRRSVHPSDIILWEESERKCTISTDGDKNLAVLVLFYPNLPLDMFRVAPVEFYTPFCPIFNFKLCGVFQIGLIGICDDDFLLPNLRSFCHHRFHRGWPLYK